MQINRLELLEKLTLLKPGLTSKEIIEQTTHFLFNENIISTFNDQIAISLNFNIGFKGAVKADPLYRLLEKIKKEEIGINIEEDQLIIKGGRTKASIILEEISTQLEIKEPNNKWNNLPQNFCDSANFCAFSASKDNTKPILTCLFINNNKIMSCDTIRATQKSIDNINDSFLLQAEIILILKNYNPIKYNITDNWIHFENKDKVLFSCRRIYDEEYPNLDDIFNIEGDSIQLPKNLMKIIDTTSILIDADFMQDKEILVTIKSEKIICKGTGSLGWIRSSKKIKYKGEQIKFSINPFYFKEILKFTDTIIINEDKSKALFKTDEFEHVISLI